MTALARHPWNTDFTWTDHTGPFRRVTAEQAHAYDEQGFFVLLDAIDAEMITALTTAIEPLDAEVMEFLAAQPDGRFSIAGVDTVSIALHPAARSTVCRDFCTSELMADLAHDLIGPDVRLYWDHAHYSNSRNVTGSEGGCHGPACSVSRPLTSRCHRAPQARHCHQSEGRNRVSPVSLVGLSKH